MSLESDMREVTSAGHNDSQEGSSVFTLAQASESIRHDDSEWRSSRAPTPGVWVRLTHSLARADKAATALTGLHSLLREHHLASDSARDCGSEYVGITDFQAGCIGDAMDCLIWATVAALDDVRETTTTQEGH